MGALPRGRRRPRAHPSTRRSINERILAAGGPIPHYATRSATACAARRSWRTAPTTQKQRYLRPLFTGEEVWCQLFSEPGAGSDVAGLSTRAVRDGDEWIVNGQKVWTTLAHLSPLGLLLARTDPEPPSTGPHRTSSSTCTRPGVEVRPLRQMTGEAEFNEVYFTDVRIPDASASATSATAGACRSPRS